ncbi:hypothetical protein JTB14_025384 [Gonioctena quinquepunctata]|nr:hypothetical protein JTB14_025384 [Gonioctena quinquepunctata]
MTGDDSKKLQKCKGVNTWRELSKTQSESESTSTTPCGRSLNRVKTEVQTVIELMGPTTPHFHLSMSSSNNADNEDSFYSTTPTSSSKNKNKLEEDSLLTECDCSTLPADPPQDNPTTHEDFSMMVDKPSTLIDIPDHETLQYICPRPMLPANFAFNSECLCPHIASYMQKESPPVPAPTTTGKPNKQQNNLIRSIFKSFRGKRSMLPKKCEYYRMNIKQSQANMGNPKRLIFNLVDDIPKPSDCQCMCQHSNEHKEETTNPCLCEDNYSKENKNFKNELLSSKQDFTNDGVFCVDEKIDPRMIKPDKNPPRNAASNKPTRVDVYYFDHGSSSFLRTTDRPPIVKTEAMAEKTEEYTTRFWAELFGTVHIGFAFITSFILQMTRFLLYSVIRPLTVGMMQLVSDYFFKPLLATFFNACIQPPLIFFYNIASSVRDCCDPVAEGIGYFLREIAFVIRSFRIVEVKSDRCSESPCKCERSSRKNRLL